MKADGPKRAPSLRLDVVAEIERAVDAVNGGEWRRWYEWAKRQARQLPSRGHVLVPIGIHRVGASPRLEQCSEERR